MPHEERMLKGAFHQHGKASFSNLNNTARRTGYSQTPYMKKSVPDMGNIYQTSGGHNSPDFDRTVDAERKVERA